MSYFFFFNDTATTEIYPLSLHDALPILPRQLCQSLCLVSAHFSGNVRGIPPAKDSPAFLPASKSDRKSTRLNSSHSQISYAVFCLKKNTDSGRTMNHRAHHTPR